MLKNAKTIGTVALLTALAATPLLAQTKAEGAQPVTPAQENPATPASASQNNPYSAHIKGFYRNTMKILLRSAEMMPEEYYRFKPTESVRTFGEVLGHLADSQYFFCSAVLGEKNPAPKIEKTKTSKADMIAALKDAFAYCDKAYDSMTDATGAETVKVMGEDRPKLMVLDMNNTHMAGHRGNLVTYMRIKGLIPPTSDPEFMKQLMKK